jgi:drug/metabolite transporter (DMT)-like permease
MLINFKKNPIAPLPSAVLFLMIAICWPKNFYPSIHFSPDWNDFLRGLFFGLAISFFALMAIHLHHRRRNG